MKNIIFLCIILRTIFSTKADCIEESAVSLESLENFDKLFVYNESDVALKKFVLCSMKNNRFVSEDGEFDTDRYLGGSNNLEYRTAIYNCKETHSNKRKDIVEYIWNLLLCINENGPNKATMYLSQCIDEAKPNLMLFKKVFLDGQYYIDDDKVKDVIFCLYKKLGIISNDGTLAKENYLKIVSQNLINLYSELFDLCAIEGLRIYDKLVAFEFARCLHGPMKNYVFYKYFPQIG